MLIEKRLTSMYAVEVGDTICWFGDRGSTFPYITIIDSHSLWVPHGKLRLI